MKKEMKRLIIPAMTALLCGCWNSWEIKKKDWASDFSSLKREVIVYDSMCGKELWHFTGEVYVKDCSKQGDISVVYRDENGRAYKNDFLGRHIAISLQEVK